ncbi:MAG: DMT family transporter [Candidatus Lambdaproteobacteria bacterium]|nr:DMT family transporter [Candidatus Lambdaproteobacteria bacterium]
MAQETWFYLGLAVANGMLSAVHVPINGALGYKIGSPLVATFAFYATAFAVISVLSVIFWDARAFRELAVVPRWYYLAGLISVAVVGSSTFLIPRIGALNLFVIVLTAQLLGRALISHFGWLESPITPFSLHRALGAVLLIAGALLVVRK